MTRYVVVLVTCPTRRAKRLAKALIQRRLAACVNILPAVQSLFWWQGQVDHAREALLVVKTSRGAFERLRRTVVSLHPYDVPEIIALPIGLAHQPYLQWIQESLKPS